MVGSTKLVESEVIESGASLWCTPFRRPQIYSSSRLPIYLYDLFLETHLGVFSFYWFSRVLRCVHVSTFWAVREPAFAFARLSFFFTYRLVA